MEALECSKRYETQGSHIEPDVGSLQLANTYAKYYLARHEDPQLMKVLNYIPNVIQKVAHLKKGKLFKLAIDEYIKGNHYKDAERLMIAQEMFDRGIKLAESSNNSSLKARFILFKVTSAIYHKGAVDEELNESLIALTRSTSPTVQAQSLLLSGIIQSKPFLCKEAITLYTDSCVNIIGALESFNQYVILKKRDVTYSLVIVKCFEAQELIKVFRSNSSTPTRSKSIQQMLEFYKLSRLNDIYLLSRSQDVWVRSLLTAVQDTDENGMLLLDPNKVHSLLVDRYTYFWNHWLVETEVEKQMLARFSTYSFHREVTEQGYLTSYLHGFPPNLVREYIQVVDAAIKVSQLSTNKMFCGLDVESLPLKLFSFQVSLCLPLSKMNCFHFRRSETVHPILLKMLDSFINYRSLKQPHVDELFKAWLCQSLIDSDRPNYFEETIEAFAKREGPGGHSKSWLVVDRHSNDAVYHHFFVFWLKACRLVKESSQVIVAAKLAYNCFFTVIARRLSLRKTISVINYIFPLSVFATALLGVLSVGRPHLGICIPVFYRYQCQLFDILNIQGIKQFWLLSASVQLAEQKKNDKRTLEDAIDILYQMLELLLGRYHRQFNLLQFALSSDSNALEDGSLIHCLVCVFVLLANLEILRPQKQNELYQLLTHVKDLIEDALSNAEIRTPPYLKAVLEKLQSVVTIADLFSIVQIIYQSANYPTALGKLQPAKSGNMDFKELSVPPQQVTSLLIRPKSPTPPPPPPLDKEPPQSLPVKLLPEVSPSVQEPSPVEPSTLQQQWLFNVQRLEELRQYHDIVEQQLHQLRQAPRHLITQTHEQQQYLLTQQYYQILQTQQQFQLQQEALQQQYQLMLTNSGVGHNGPPLELTAHASPLPGGATPSSDQPDDDDIDLNFDEEEIERILGSFMSASGVGEVINTANPLEESYNLAGVDDELVDKRYCQVCGVTFMKEQRNTLLDELELEEGESISYSLMPHYKEHVRTQSHLDNVLAYKRFSAVRLGPYSELRTSLDEVLKRGQKLSSIAAVDAILLQVNSELFELNEQLDESINSYNWREAHSRLVNSLDVLHSYALRLTRTCEIVHTQTPLCQEASRFNGEGVGDDCDVEEIDITHGRKKQKYRK